MTRLVCFFLLLVLNAKIALLFGAEVFSDGVGLPGALAFREAPITNAANRLGLSRIQASQERPVQLEGVVTRVDKLRGILVLQNEREVVAIHSDWQSLAVQPGQTIRVRAEKAAGWQPVFPEFPLKATDRIWLTNFSTPLNWGSYYLSRTHGYLIPPVSGDYRFWVASKGSSELWLSPNADAAGIRRIANVPDNKAANPKQWEKFPTQASEVIRLKAGQPCLLDVLHEHRAGRDDTVAVAWQGPGMERTVIDAKFLVPYSNHNTNGIVCEYWNDYLLVSVLPLTTGEMSGIELVVKDPQIDILGEAHFPDPIPVELGVKISPEQNFRWAEVEGVIRFAARDVGELILDLAQDRSRVRLVLPAAANLNPAELVGSRVRARGVREAVLNENGDLLAGTIWVPSTNELIELGTDNGNFQQLKVTSIGDLHPANPGLASGRRVRLRGTVIQQSSGRLVVQGTTRLCGYISTNGADWTPLTSPVDINMHGSALGGLLASSFKSTELITAYFDSVSGVSEAARDWEIASVDPIGKTTVLADSKFIVSGSGTGFGSTFERFHFFCGALGEKMEIIARLTAVKSGEAESVAGIMMRNSVDPRASFASLSLNADGQGLFRFRQSQGERDDLVAFSSALPCWLKLSRSFPTVEVRVDKNVSASVGDDVDLIGSLEWDGERPHLAGVRRLDRPASNGASNLPDKKPDDVVQSRLAQLVPERGEGLREGSGSIIVRGVVTFTGSAFGSNYMILQDETAGAMMRLTMRFSRRSPSVGQLVEFEIKSQNGKWPFPPDPYRMQVIGTAQLPEPLSLAAANTQIRRGEYRWVECRGIVREVTAGSSFNLVSQNGEIPVWLNGASAAELHGLQDALVRARGVLVYRDNRTSLLVPSFADLEVIEAAPLEPFSIPTVAIDQLGGFSRRPAYSHRVKIAGVVTFKNERLLVVQDNSGGVRVKVAAPTDVQTGESVEVAGFSEGQPGSLQLSQALVRRGEKKSLPAPITISGEEFSAGNQGARVVQLVGELVAQKSEGKNHVLEIQSGQRIFRAELMDNKLALKTIPVGSRVRVTGVLWLETFGVPFAADEKNESLAAAYGILMRLPEDVIILKLPPWWAWKHATLIIGTLGLVLVLAILWIRYLRLKVARRTQQLNETLNQLENKTRISATLAERDRLAGEIHDSIEQGLSAIVIQIESALKHSERMDKARRHLDMAKSMAVFSRTEVQNAVWDMQSPLLENVDLAGALRRVSQGISAGDRPRVVVEIDGPVLPLTSTVEHHLLRIAQEAITNAVKHANPDNITIQLHYQSGQVILTIQDDGSGFVPGNVSTSGGHFGLQGMRGRAQKIEATMAVESKVGGGTRIEVVVPCGKV